MRRFLLILLVLVLIPLDSYSASFTDIDDEDNMRKGVTIYDPTDPDYIVNIVEEFIGENQLTPYDSPGGGYGIVNQAGGFFDMWVLPFSDEINAEIASFSFYVINNSNFHWSDFHFEFYRSGDVGFEPLNLFVRSVQTDAAFDQKSFTDPGNYSVIDFWSDTQGVAPGGSVGLTIEMDLSNWIYPEEFMLRQIATTAVPIPGAFILLASSLICFAGFRRKLNR